MGFREGTGGVYRLRTGSKKAETGLPVSARLASDRYSRLMNRRRMYQNIIAIDANSAIEAAT